jgi:hypothetical protein
MTRNEWMYFGPFLAIPVLMLCFLGWRIWWCHAQAAIWQEQGVKITTFEVFFGMKPAGTPGGQR